MFTAIQALQQSLIIGQYITIKSSGNPGMIHISGQFRDISHFMLYLTVHNCVHINNDSHFTILFQDAPHHTEATHIFYITVLLKIFLVGSTLKQVQ